MANQVFANGMEIACKAAGGKSIAAFPDTCLSPPSPPAGPVPLPYPNTAYAKDTTDGSKTVMISGQEVMLKDQSVFKKSTGDEAATKTLGMGVVTHTIQGEASFVAWSMNVKVEGQNVDRHLDMMLHNEQCTTANTPVMVYVDESAFGKLATCADDKAAMESACEGKDPCPGVLSVPKATQRTEVALKADARIPAFGAHERAISQVEGARTAKAAAAAEAEADGSECVSKARCYLRPYSSHKDQDGCCPGQTGHHIPPKACFQDSAGKYLGDYSEGGALCACMEGMNQHCGSHGKNHAAIEWLAKEKHIKVGQICPVEDYNRLCAETLEAQCGCDKDCVKAQLDQQSRKNNVTTAKHVTTNSSSGVSEQLKSEIRESAKLPVDVTASVPL